MLGYIGRTLDVMLGYLGELWTSCLGTLDIMLGHAWVLWHIMGEHARGWYQPCRDSDFGDVIAGDLAEIVEHVLEHSNSHIPDSPRVVAA